MIDRLVLFGASGDLTARYLLPGLAALHATGRLPEGFRLVGADRRDMDDAAFRGWVAEQLAIHGAAWPADSRDAVVAAVCHRRADAARPEEVAAAVEAAGDGPVAVYLALPPSLFPAAVDSLGSAALPAGSRIALEKPFGDGLDDAVRLNRVLARLVPEEAVFRIDHFLAMTTVQNLLGLRLANRVLEPIWNSTHIDRVDIVWEETLALEGRAGYYDRAGALKDMLQNHLLQLLCLVAMEPPVSLDERDLRNRKVDVLRSVRPLADADLPGRTRRARYTRGRIGDRAIPAYVDEPGVDPARRTETFAEIELELDSWRWAGTRFLLRSGKALGRDRKDVTVRFRRVPHLPFGLHEEPPPNLLRFGLDPEDLTLRLSSTSGGGALAPVALGAALALPELPAYGRVLFDLLSGDPALALRGDEAEESWRIVAPVLSAWSRDAVPLEEYPAGSPGPGQKDGA